MDLACLLAALCFCVGNIFVIANEMQTRNDGFDFQELMALDPLYIEQMHFRSLNWMPLHVVANVMNSAGWLVLTFPFMQVCVVLSEGGNRRVLLHVTMAVLVLSAATMEAMCRLFNLGSGRALNHMADKFELDDWTGNDEKFGWKVFEMLRIMTNGLFMWIDSFEYLALFLVLIMNNLSVRSSNMKHFGATWADFGVLIAIFAIFDFAFNLLRLKEWGLFQQLGLIVAIVNRLVCLPIWLIMMGKQLPQAYVEFSRSGYGVEEQEQEARESEDPIVSSLELTPAASGNSFTIDDSEDAAKSEDAVKSN